MLLFIFILLAISFSSIEAKKDELFVGKCLDLNKTNDEVFLVEDIQIFKKGQVPVLMKKKANRVSKVVIEKEGWDAIINPKLGDYLIPVSLAKRLSIYKPGNSGNLYLKCGQPLEVGVKIDGKWYSLPLYDRDWPRMNQSNKNKKSPNKKSHQEEKCRTNIFVSYNDDVRFGDRIGEKNCQKMKQEYWKGF